MAGLDMSKEDPFRVGVIVGSGVGSLQAIEREYKKLLEKGPSRVNLMLVPMMISNMAAGNVSIQLGAKGKCTDVVTACASGTHSIGDAFRATVERCVSPEEPRMPLHRWVFPDLPT